MIHPAPGARVYLACRPVDMRRGFDGLAADVAKVLQADPYSGAVFVFRGKRGDYLKILTWDGSGLCLRLNGEWWRRWRIMRNRVKRVFLSMSIPYQRLWAVTTVCDRSRIIVSVC